MTAPQTQPLAALLASHPEECAAVVAVLACAGPNGGLDAADARRLGIDPLALYRVCGALQSAGIVGKYTQAFCLEDPADARAIARMGAAAWLAARVAPCG